MSHRVRTRLASHINLTLGNEGAGNGCPQQINTLIQTIGTHHGKDIVTHKLQLQIQQVCLSHPQFFGFGKSFMTFIALSDVGGDGHHLTAISLS